MSVNEDSQDDLDRYLVNNDFRKLWQGRGLSLQGPGFPERDDSLRFSNQVNSVLLLTSLERGVLSPWPEAVRALNPAPILLPRSEPVRAGDGDRGPARNESLYVPLPSEVRAT